MGEVCQQLAAQVVKIKVRPTGSLRRPDEPLAVLQETDRGRVGDPARPPFLAHNDAAFARTRLGGAKLENILPPVGASEQQFSAVLRPGDAINVMSGNCILKRLAIPN